MATGNRDPTPDDPFPTRFYAYLKERFNPVSNMLLIVSYYSSNQFLAHVLMYPGTPMSYSTHSLMGAITVLCMFFHLRVFDEHKDYEEDCRHYPNRILQKGMVTLSHLKIAGAIAIGTELIMGFLLGPAALAAILAAIAFSVLMLKEFFIKNWLRNHFLIYATSHMLIMPLFAMVIFSATTGRYPWEAPHWYWFYSFVGFFVTFNWEVSRKIRAPEDEIQGVDSYTKVFGTYGAGYMVLLIRIIDTAMVALVGNTIGAGPWFFASLILLFCVCMGGFLHYRFNTNTRTAKRMEIYAGMYIIAFDLILALEIISKYGFHSKL